MLKIDSFQTKINQVINFLIILDLSHLFDHHKRKIGECFNKLLQYFIQYQEDF